MYVIIILVMMIILSMLQKYYLIIQCVIIINDILLIHIGVNHWYQNIYHLFHRDLWDYHQIWKYNRILIIFLQICNRSNMYQCVNSLKCISKSSLWMII